MNRRRFVQVSRFSYDLAIWGYGLGTGIIVGAIATMSVFMEGLA